MMATILCPEYKHTLSSFQAVRTQPNAHSLVYMQFSYMATIVTSVAAKLADVIG